VHSRSGQPDRRSGKRSRMSVDVHLVRKVMGAVVLLVALAGCSQDPPATPTSPTWSTTPAPPTPSAAATAPTAAPPTATSTTASLSTRASKTRAAARTRTATPTRPKLTCEPDSPARLVGNSIVNKDCPEINAAKERAQRGYAKQQARRESDAALEACREQTGKTTAECIADAKAGNAS
jgi:hypothetical protein